MKAILFALMVAPLLAPAASGRIEVLASELIGMEVVDARGEPIGELEDLVFDVRDGKILSAIIDYGGRLGGGEREVALPAEPLAQRGDKIVLRTPEEALRSAATLEAPAWPAMRASALIDREVRDRLHRDAGEIVNLVLELATGRVHYALIDTRDDWKPGRELAAVPIEDFSLPRDMGRFATLNVTRENMRAR